jgi:hypothetical protein
MVVNAYLEVVSAHKELVLVKMEVVYVYLLYQSVELSMVIPNRRAGK